MNRVASVLSALALAACTTTSTMQLGADRAMLTTRGNAFTSSEAVQRDLMLEAARQTLARGYEWFAIEGAQDVSRSGVYASPASGSAYASGNAYGWSGAANYTGASYMPYTKPGVQVLVRFGSGGRPYSAFDAAEIIALNDPKR